MLIDIAQSLTNSTYWKDSEFMVIDGNHGVEYLQRTKGPDFEISGLFFKVFLFIILVDLFFQKNKDGVELKDHVLIELCAAHQTAASSHLRFGLSFILFFSSISVR